MKANALPSIIYLLGFVFFFSCTTKLKKRGRGGPSSILSRVVVGWFHESGVEPP
jgi:hypothetical protein